MNELKDTKILVSGGAGFVGSNLVRRILSHRPKQILVVDNLLSAERSNIPDDSRIAFEECSIGNDDFLNGLSDDFDFVFHLATYHGNQNSIFDPLADHENNTLTTLKLLNHYSRDKKVEKIVYSSAGCSIAEKTYQKAKATEESDVVSLWMDSPYSISKLIGELYSNYFFKQHGVPAVRARFQNVYGPGEILGAGQWRGTDATVWRNVVPTFVYQALGKQPLTVENQGKASRDFIYVDDVVHGLILCATKGKAGQAYNIATGKETTILRLATMINELAGNKGNIYYKQRRAWDTSGKRFGSTKKSSIELGFIASIELIEGLRRTVQWTIDHMSEIDACISRHKSRMAES